MKDNRERNDRIAEMTVPRDLPGSARGQSKVCKWVFNRGRTQQAKTLKAGLSMFGARDLAVMGEQANGIIEPFSCASGRFVVRLQAVLSISTRTTVLACTERKVDVTACLCLNQMQTKVCNFVIQGHRGLASLVAALTGRCSSKVKRTLESDGHSCRQCVLVWTFVARLA